MVTENTDVYQQSQVLSLEYRRFNIKNTKNADIDVCARASFAVFIRSHLLELQQCEFSKILRIWQLNIWYSAWRYIIYKNWNNKHRYCMLLGEQLMHFCEQQYYPQSIVLSLNMQIHPQSVGIIPNKNYMILLRTERVILNTIG